MVSSPTPFSFLPVLEISYSIDFFNHFFSCKHLKSSKYCAPNKLVCLGISNLTAVVILVFLIGQEKAGNLIET